MSKMNAIEKSRYIDRNYKRYLRSSFHFGNERMRSMFDEQLEKETLYKGPYVGLTLPFKRGKSINQLIDEGEVCSSFRQLDNVPFDRPLYLHQEQAIRLINDRRSIVVTTGTGSGKTESFLFPIINNILRDIETGKDAGGVRAIFLYPMNALVNDQIDRLRGHLQECPSITFGSYTGDTPEKNAEDIREQNKIEHEAGKVDYLIPDNELLTREEIRNNPPHLLFTNYSMLEFLLLRPKDADILSSESLRNWDYVVLDEAHSYAGAKGIELSMLMRRVTGLTENKPRFILTSATLGEEGKSEGAIVDFARKLTSATFDETDIIFSRRIPLSAEQLQYSVDGEDYIELAKAVTDEQGTHTICQKYLTLGAASPKEQLYELLIRDKNTYKLYDALKEGSLSFDEILKLFEGSLDEKQLSALIDVINRAEKNGINLFDLKYHSFVRPLMGAFVTLGDNGQLSLTKTNAIDDKKAFELGNCKYCYSSFIFGKMLHNQKDGRTYLFQNDEVDIYENYGDVSFINLDFFALDISEDAHDDERVEEYCLCRKCACIYPKNQLTARKCECGSEHEITVYRVKEQTNNNNITYCPYCGRSSNSALVKSLNLGKDEGTAFIAQTLLEALDDPQKKTKTAAGRKISLLGTRREDTHKDEYVKQFLSFSDSRQQASFAAAFMDSNHTRMLRKRLIWDVIEKNNYADLNVDMLASELTSIIKSKHLFDHTGGASGELTPHKNAWITLLVDLLEVDGNYDGEGLGLYFFDLDLSILDDLEEEEVEAVFGKYELTKEDLKTLFQEIFSVFKTTPAIDSSKSTLTPDEKMEFLEYRRFDNSVALKLEHGKSNVKSLCPIAGGNSYVRYVEKACRCSSNEAKEIITILWEQIAKEGGIIKESDSSIGSYVIDANKYLLKNYKTSKYYRCSKCGMLTPHNVHDVCVQDKCDGKLELVNPDEVLEHNYYRQQYKEKKIEPIRIEEHTAQINRKTAKQLQNDFKDKKINVLSCSTTFEMGIDIGGLDTVYMRNIPPSPANYIQRAGRAGRRSDSSAFILTYCNSSSHDYYYYNEPEKMISGTINPPYFDVLNDKIIHRHLMATCLSAFFKEEPLYYSDLELLTSEQGIAKVNGFISSKPAYLTAYIDGRVLPEDAYSDYHDFQWFEGHDEKLESFAKEKRDLQAELAAAEENASKQGNHFDAGYYQQQLKKLYDQDTISELSKASVIPKYGFPVDVVNLDVYNDNGRKEYDLDLSRDLKIAISEYAPDSEIIVQKKKYTSKYVSLPHGESLGRMYFCTCPSCQKVNIFISPDTGGKCRYCEAPIADYLNEYFVEPTLGFKTGKTKESTRMKPKRSYAGEVSYLGKGKEQELFWGLDNSIKLTTTSETEMLVMNRSQFYMCPTCGYSNIVKKGDHTSPSKTVSHKTYRQIDCSNKKLDLLSLGHRFKTDVARLEIPSLTVSEPEGFVNAISFLYALLEGVSLALDIDRDDIDGIVELSSDRKSYDVVIYDDVPGGAGHVKRLANDEALKQSLELALKRVSQDCCDEETSCYNCIRNYRNQTYHSRLRRRNAKVIIQRLLK